MKNIYVANLYMCGEDEWQLGESSLLPFGREWDGDVKGYVENLELPDGVEILEECPYTVHNLPANAIIVLCCGNPVECYWAKEE